MDPYAPIAGISLERYADLGAELDGITGDDAQAEKVAELGIARADWEAAKLGWTARMQDMSLMGQVATRYMPLYNAAIAKKKGNATCSLEDYCAVSAAIQVFGYEAGVAHHKVSMGDWTTISAHWQVELSRDPMNLGAHRNRLQEEEAGRLRAGGQPRSIQIVRSAAGAAPAGGAAAFDPNAQMAMSMQAAAVHNAPWMAQAAALYGPGVYGQAAVQVAGAMSAMGAGNGLVLGAKVLVQWNDGNRYPATIIQLAGTQAQVVFPDGRNLWIDHQYLTPG